MINLDSEKRVGILRFQLRRPFEINITEEDRIDFKSIANAIILVVITTVCLRMGWGSPVQPQGEVWACYVAIPFYWWSFRALNRISMILVRGTFLDMKINTRSIVYQLGMVLGIGVVIFFSIEARVRFYEVNPRIIQLDPKVSGILFTMLLGVVGGGIWAAAMSVIATARCLLGFPRDWKGAVRR